MCKESGSRGERGPAGLSSRSPTGGEGTEGSPVGGERGRGRRESAGVKDVEKMSFRQKKESGRYRYLKTVAGGRCAKVRTEGLEKEEACPRDRTPDKRNDRINNKLRG